jgi:DnaJ-class molecular chaperone
MSTPWQVLGLNEGADQHAIKAAYRKLARQYHPDLHPDDPTAIDRFLELGEAYQALTSPAERAEEAAEVESPSLRVEVPFAIAYDGGQVQVELPVDATCPSCGGLGCKRCENGKVVKKVPFTVSIPPGLVAGMLLRAHERNGRNGRRELPVIAEILPSPLFKRVDGQPQDLVLELPVTISEAVLGATVRVPTPTEIVHLKIPAGTPDGKVFRIQGGGMPLLARPGEHGNLIIRIRLAIPAEVNPGQRRALEELARYEGDPRAGLLRGL